MMKPRPEEALFKEFSFIEATGIEAGVAPLLRKSFERHLKAVVKATLKLVAKVGTRTLGRAGLVMAFQS